MSAQSKPAALGRPQPRNRKYFSLAEANRALPYLSRIIEDLVAGYHRTVAARARMDHAAPAPASGGRDAAESLQAEYDAAMDRLNDLVEELRQAGVEIKDFEKGLVDFPATHQGREILLCWRRGEKQIEHWHELDAGFAGRQDVALLENN